jgi:transcriptional regulator with XRE-family HTH domain
MNYFSKNLKYLRKENNISRSELASKLKINQSTISRWENDNMGATIDNAYDVSQFFNVSIADLIGKDLSTIQKQSEVKNGFKKILIENGFLSKDENITEEEAKKLIDFALANKDYLIKNNKNNN